MSERPAASRDYGARIGGAPRGRAARSPGKGGGGTRSFGRFEWMLALRYLRPRRKEAFFSVISMLSLAGIAIGVAALIIVMAVMNGFRHEIVAKILGMNGHILIEATGGSDLSEYDALAAKIRKIPGIVRVAPIVDGQVMGSANGVNALVLVRGVRRDDLETLTSVSKSISNEAMAHFEGGDSLIVGSRMAMKFGTAPGMQLTLIAPRGNVTPFGTTPRVKSYTVAGTFNVGMSEYDQTYAFMPLEEAQLYFNMDKAVTALEVRIADPDNADDYIQPIAAAAGPSVRIVTWKDMNSTLSAVLTTERNVMFLILTLIILVAALNMVSGLVMLVKDKSGDIGILRTMGATRGTVMRVFLIAGASIGIIGTLVGFVIGVVFCAYIEEIRQFLSMLLGVTLFDPTIYFLSRMPADMDTGEVAAVVIMALTLSFLATLYPSWRAARLDPVEALRYE